MSSQTRWSLGLLAAQCTKELARFPFCFAYAEIHSKLEMTH